MTIYSPRNRTTGIIVHCTATPPTSDIGVKEVREMHRKRGFVDIGYHYVIRRNGDVEVGRPLHTIGAHVSGFNAETIGISLVGGINASGKAENNYTPAQMESLELLIRQLLVKYPGCTVRGHRDYSPDINKNGVIEGFERIKECPCFDVIPWWLSKQSTEETLATTYTVASGDTYWGISRKLGVSLVDLMDVNPTLPAYALKPGAVLRLP